MASSSNPIKPEPEVATAKLFMNGRSQAVRLPKAFRFEGDTVQIRRSGNGVLLEPVKRKRTREEIMAWLDRLHSYDAGEAIPGGRKQPEMPVRNWSK